MITLIVEFGTRLYLGPELVTQDKPTRNRLDDDRIFFDGSHLAELEVSKLEHFLLTKPTHLKSRLLLLGYYQHGYYKTFERGQRFLTHLLWLIENAPDNSALSHLMMLMPDEHFRAAKKYWLRAIRSDPGNVVILKHAAQCCLIPSPKDTRRFLMEAQKLEPLNEDWALELSNAFRPRSPSRNWRSDRILANKSCRYGKQALELHEQYPKNSYLETYTEMVVSEMIATAFFFGFREYVCFFGEYLIRQGQKKLLPHQRRRSLNFRTQMGYSTLGRLALRDGNKQLAKDYLSKMDVLGDPDWRSDLVLARELLNANEGNSVIEYLEGCVVNFNKRLHQFDKKGADPYKLPALMSIEHEHFPSMDFSEYACSRLENKIGELVRWRTAIEKRREVNLPDYI